MFLSKQQNANREFIIILNTMHYSYKLLYYILLYYKLNEFPLIIVRQLKVCFLITLFTATKSKNDMFKVGMPTKINLLLQKFFTPKFLIYSSFSYTDIRKHIIVKPIGRLGRYIDRESKCYQLGTIRNK